MYPTVIDWPASVVCHWSDSPSVFSADDVEKCVLSVEVVQVPKTKKNTISSGYLSFSQREPAQTIRCRASALKVGGHGFDPRPSHTRDYNNGT